MTTTKADAARLAEEPPMGSVVAIDWGEYRQEVWVSNSANVGNWYTPDIPLSFGPRDQHPTWWDVLKRAQGRTLTLLVAADADTYRTGFDAGVSAVAAKVEAAIDEARP